METGGKKGVTINNTAKEFARIYVNLSKYPSTPVISRFYRLTRVLSTVYFTKNKEER